MLEGTSPKTWTLGDRIRYVRLQWGLRQREIQERGGPSRITLVRLEKNHGGVDTTFRSTIDSLSKVLGCRSEWLITGEGPIWAEGIRPPEGLRVGNAMFRVMGKDLPPRCPEGTADRGRWITEGPIDWAIVARAIRLLDDAIQINPSAIEKSISPFSVPLALQLLYTHLAQQDDPLFHTDPKAVEVILSVASR
jgi:hypothetical protein